MKPPLKAIAEAWLVTVLELPLSALTFACLWIIA